MICTGRAMHARRAVQCCKGDYLVAVWISILMVMVTFHAFALHPRFFMPDVFGVMACSINVSLIIRVRIQLEIKIYSLQVDLSFKLKIHSLALIKQFHQACTARSSR